MTALLQSLNGRRLDLCRIDNRLSFMYKITHDLVAIPKDQYLTVLQRQSRTSHPMAYRQIATSTDYIKYSFFPRTIVHWNSLPPEVVFLPNVDDFNRAVSLDKLLIVSPCGSSLARVMWESQFCLWMVRWFFSGYSGFRPPSMNDRHISEIFLKGP